MTALGYGALGLSHGATASWTSYILGRAAKVYLQQGCQWGTLGIKTVIQQILQQAKADSVVERLRRRPPPEGRPVIGTLDVAVYGIVNAGKSSLINALVRSPERDAGPIGGTTADVAGVDWTVVEQGGSGGPDTSPMPSA